MANDIANDIGGSINLYLPLLYIFAAFIYLLHVYLLHVPLRLDASRTTCATYQSGA